MIKQPPKRITDIPPYFTVQYQLRHNHVLVRCPKCGGAAELRLVEDDSVLQLCCQQCYHTVRKRCARPVRAVRAICAVSGRWLNISVTGNYPMAQVKCPYCGQRRQYLTAVTGENENYALLSGYELYFQTDYRGQKLWALNSDHLNFLRDYIAAELRQKAHYTGPDGRQYILAGTQGSKLPRHLTAGKNRRGVLRALEKMRRW